MSKYKYFIQSWIRDFKADSPPPTNQTGMSSWLSEAFRILLASFGSVKIMTRHFIVKKSNKTDIFSLDAPSEVVVYVDEIT